MRKVTENRTLKRIGSMLLILALVVPMLLIVPQNVYAGGSVELGSIIQGANEDGTITAGKTVYVTMEDLDEKYGGGFSAKYNAGQVEVQFVVGDVVKIVYLDTATNRFSYKTSKSESGKTIILYTNTLEDDSSYNNNSNSYIIRANTIDVSGMNSKGVVTVTGSCAGTTFTSLDLYSRPDTVEKYIDSYSVGISGEQAFSKQIDMSQYDPGYYEICAKLADGNELIYEKVVPALIYDKPQIKKNENFLSVGSSYICYRPYFTVPPEYDGVYMQLYDTKTKKWGDVYGPFGSYEILKTQYFTGTPQNPGIKIQANRSYKIRTFFATMVKYGGSQYPLYGPFNESVTVKTGQGKKPPVKSIQITNVKYKKIKLIQHAHWDISGRWWPYKEDYTWSTIYTVKVTMKKKPGTAGICIGSKRIKGNKKTYKATFESSGKLRGKKLTVEVCTYNDAKIGAYSPAYKKKVKVK